MTDSSTFADRLWWARHRAGLGATRLARMVGCAQSLISSLERNNAERSRLNNKFADALGVHRNWLAYGTAPVPPGFDPEQARKGRGNMSEQGASVVSVPHLPRIGEIGAINMAVGGSSADALMKQLISLFLDFAKVAGPERTKGLIGTFEHLSGMVTFEEVPRQQ